MNHYSPPEISSEYYGTTDAGRRTNYKPVRGGWNPLHNTKLQRMPGTAIGAKPNFHHHHQSLLFSPAPGSPKPFNTGNSSTYIGGTHYTMATEESAMMMLPATQTKTAGKSLRPALVNSKVNFMKSRMQS
jgi:hypothetical protein